MTIDLPGFGRSFGVRGGRLPLQEESRMIGYLLRRIARSTGAPLVLVGHDVGGAIAQLCAIQWPGIVSGLVLINSAALTRAPVHLNVGTFCLRARRRLARLLDHRSARALTREDKDAISAAWQDRTLRATMHSVFESWRESWPGPHERKAWGSKLTGLSQPTLLLWGRQDQISEIDHADELIRMIPEAYLFEHELCGHWPSLEDRDWVHRKMTEFLFRTEERQLIAI